MGVHVQTVSSQLYNELRDRLIAGHFPPGQPIRQDALAQEYGVSKIPVREALFRLEREGLIASEANRGFFVIPLTLEEAEDVYTLRLQMEPEAVAQASLIATPKDRQAAQMALSALNLAAQTDRLRVPHANRMFHLSLVRPLKKPVTVSFIERLHIISERNIGEHLAPAGGEDQAHQEHSTMLEYWLSGRADEVRVLVHHHIEATFVELKLHYC